MKQHLAYMDILRVIAAAFVVFMHTAASGLRYQVAAHTGWYLLAAASSLTFSAVPLFFMISGYLLTASSRTADIPVLLKERLPRLAVPLICWSVLHILWNMHITADWRVSVFFTDAASALQTCFNPTLWFMYTLIGIYLISPVLCTGLRSLDRNGVIFVLALILLLKLRSVVSILFPAFYEDYLNFEILNSLEFYGSHLSSFILGWYLGSMKRRIPQPVLLCVSILLWGMITAGTVLLSRAGGEYVSSFQRQNAGFEVLLACCLFLLAKQLDLSSDSRLMRFLHRLAPGTYPVYLMHALLLGVLYQFFTPLRFIVIVCCSAGVYITSLLLSMLFSRIPVVSFLLCGIRRTRS